MLKLGLERVVNKQSVISVFFSSKSGVERMLKEVCSLFTKKDQHKCA